MKYVLFILLSIVAYGQTSLTSIFWSTPNTHMYARSESETKALQTWLRTEIEGKEIKVRGVYRRGKNRRRALYLKGDAYSIGNHEYRPNQVHCQIKLPNWDSHRTKIEGAVRHTTRFTVVGMAKGARVRPWRDTNGKLVYLVYLNLVKCRIE